MGLIITPDSLAALAGASAGKIIVSDGTGFVASTPTYPNAAAAAGAVLIGDGTNFVQDTTPTFIDLVTFAAGTTSIAPYNLPSGTLKTSPAVGDNEFDGTAFYETVDITSGRSQIRSEQIFRLAANLGTRGGSIADYFDASSAYPTVTNGVYELIWELFFLKNTSGTVTWTITNTQAYTNIAASFTTMTAAGGMDAVGQSAGAGIVTTTTAAAALPASSSLTTAKNHHHRVRAVAECGTAGNIRLQVTCGAGTITPLRGSMFYARRLFAGNVGTFVA